MILRLVCAYTSVQVYMWPGYAVHACVCVWLCMCITFISFIRYGFLGNLLFVRNSVYIWLYRISFVVELILRIDSNVNKINEPSCFIEWEKLIELYIYTLIHIRMEERLE